MKPIQKTFLIHTKDNPVVTEILMLITMQIKVFPGTATLVVHRELDLDLESDELQFSETTFACSEYSSGMCIEASHTDIKSLIHQAVQKIFNADPLKLQKALQHKLNA